MTIIAIDLVKIDMDLIRNVDQSRPRQAIVAGIAAICRDLDIRVLAEGIETRAERDFPLRAGISLMQGYWFAKPAFKSLAVIADAAWE